MKKTYIQPLVTVENDEIESQLLADSIVLDSSVTVSDESNLLDRDEDAFSAW